MQDPTNFGLILKLYSNSMKSVKNLKQKLFKNKTNQILPNSFYIPIYTNND